MFWGKGPLKELLFKRLIRRNIFQDKSEKRILVINLKYDIWFRQKKKKYGDSHHFQFLYKSKCRWNAAGKLVAFKTSAKKNITMSMYNHDFHYVFNPTFSC
jgi:hypothetical protein